MWGCFKLKAKVTGEKKVGAEAVAIKDPDDGNLIYETDDIKAASLKYVQNLLKDEEPDEQFSFEIKVKELLHDVRMTEIVNDDDHDELTKDDFHNVLDMLKNKSKEKYKFILNAGSSLKEALFRLFRNVWKQEARPQQWKSTTIIQLYKGKGEMEDLNNHRNIHTKEDVPKAFEMAVVDFSKPKIVTKCSKFQIGGMPGHRPSEHLYCIKSIMVLFEQMDIPLIMQFFDIAKYFDSEVLRDAMASLYEAGICGKLYRLLFELNKETEIMIKTGVGVTKVGHVGEYVAQGSIGGGLISSLNLDVEVNNFFSGSRDEVGYSNVRLQPMILQDDISRLCSSTESARAAIRRIETMMKLKQLTINLDKSSYIVCKNSSQSQNIKDDLLQNPLTYDGIPMKEKLCEKYLGDMLSGEGLSASVKATISERHGRIFTDILEVKTILENYRANRAGGVSVGIMLWEMAILPSLLNNSETWINIDEESLRKLENLQFTMLRFIFSTPASTPKAALLWDTGILPMEQQIELKKMMFLHHLSTLPEGTLANQIYTQQK